MYNAYLPPLGLVVIGLVNVKQRDACTPQRYFYNWTTCNAPTTYIISQHTAPLNGVLTILINGLVYFKCSVCSPEDGVIVHRNMSGLL
jgi:hypothetical protein